MFIVQVLFAIESEYGPRDHFSDFVEVSVASSSKAMSDETYPCGSTLRVGGDEHIVGTRTELQPMLLALLRPHGCQTSENLVHGM